MVCVLCAGPEGGVCVCVMVCVLCSGPEGGVYKTEDASVWSGATEPNSDWLPHTQAALFFLTFTAGTEFITSPCTDHLLLQLPVQHRALAAVFRVELRRQGAELVKNRGLSQLCSILTWNLSGGQTRLSMRNVSGDRYEYAQQQDMTSRTKALFFLSTHHGLWCAWYTICSCTQQHRNPSNFSCDVEFIFF